IQDVVDVAAAKQDRERKESLESEGRVDKEFERLEELIEHFEKQSVDRRVYISEKDDKQDALQNTASKPVSLQDFLFHQFALLDLPEDVAEAGKSIIYNINDNGYLMYQLEDIFETNDHETLKTVEKALKAVQSLDPPGIGARDIKEALLLQLGNDEQYSLERRIIENHLDDVTNNKIPKIAKAMGLSIKDANKAVELLKSLSPYPGAFFSGEPAPFVIPDVVIENIEGKYEIRLENAYIPSVYVNRAYEKMASDKRVNTVVREFVRKKLESAKRLIKAIEQRKNTLYRIANEMINVQKDFLDKGISGLKPLKMQEIAGMVNVHISTVCRSIANKFIQTPRGIFPMKFFFTGGTENSSGKTESTRSIKEQIAEIISNENKEAPFCDEKIVERLKSSGLDIARRTVTKYRKALKIPSSRKRKEF
ncbi:MAG: RNA polymerase factor sigma-54, partial [Planctomycetota bacterium]